MPEFEPVITAVLPEREISYAIGSVLCDLTLFCARSLPRCDRERNAHFRWGRLCRVPDAVACAARGAEPRCCEGARPGSRRCGTTDRAKKPHDSRRKTGQPAPLGLFASQPHPSRHNVVASGSEEPAGLPGSDPKQGDVMMTDLKSFRDVWTRVPTGSHARRFLVNAIWGDDRFCPHRGSLNPRRLRGASVRAGPYQCAEKECRSQFTVTTKTPLHATKLDLRIWIAAMFLVLTSSNGISSVVMARVLGVTQKTAWKLGHAIREMIDVRRWRTRGPGSSSTLSRP
ncbi:transposase [Sulfitobacter sabulilitoris]|uniref:Transposase n=1 Tax=Sulfitobacter sabulilitoris TaxID=2562655 RepID=A0A5S3PLV4_9RHOB|nr:transposase [Sulfitobacter sabulilitoris]